MGWEQFTLLFGSRLQIVISLIYPTRCYVFWRSTFEEYGVHFNAHTFVDHKWKCYESHARHTAMFFVLFLCISCSALAGLMDILLYREGCKVAMHALIKSF